MKFERLLILLPIFLFKFSSAQNKLTLDDIFKKYKFYPESPAGFTPLKDGEHYCQIDQDERGNAALVIYSYKTGLATDTIVQSDRMIPQDSSKPIAIYNFQLSDDESKILFQTSAQQIYRHSFVASYFVYDRKTKKLIALSGNGKQEDATFSPDASKVCFVRENNLFVKDLSTGEERAITNDGKRNFIINGVCDWVYEEEFSFTQAYQWSPDGKHLAYYRFDETDVPEYTIQYFKDLYPENYTYKYPKVGEKNSVVAIHIYDFVSKQNATVDVGTETDQYIPRIKWTEDDNQLCVFRMNRLQNKLELLLADAATGKTSVMFTEENKRYINISDDLTFFNNNKNFIWTSQQTGYNHIFIYDTNGKMLNEVTKGNYDVTSFYGVDEKNKKIYYQSAEVSPLERYIYQINPDGSGKKQLTMDKGWNDASFNPTFTYMMIDHSDANTPPDYKLYNSKNQLVRTLEDNHDLKQTLSGYPLSKKEFFTFSIPEGVQLNGWMIKPWNFDPSKKYPVFMTEYGGPGSQKVTNAWGDDMFEQYLAQEGYIIACVDNRGTGARGEEFEKMTYLQLGKYESSDQISAAKYLGALPYVDKSRIGIFGWSYGGYLSSLCIELGADVFKAAIAVAPVTDWRFYDSIYTERYMQNDKTNHKGYVDGSPVTYADRIKGNFLIVAGLADDNVHYQNTATFLKKLYDNNVTFDQMTFPDKNHSISGGNTRFYLFSRMAEWIKTNL